MSSVVIAPMEWSMLKDINGVEPINEADTRCLAEIRDVLKKHGKLERFGVVLLHSHFHLSPDEIMLEEADPETRTLMTKAVKETEAGERIGTIWALREGTIEAATWCRKFCRRLGFPLFIHEKAHNRVSGK